MIKQILILILLAFIGLGNFQLHAQDETFTAGTDALWTNPSNWSNATIATGEATITNNVELDGVDVINVGVINVDQNNSPRIISNGILQLNGNSGDYIIRQWAGQGTTFNCDLIVNVSNKQFIVRGSNNSELIFANGYTLDLGTNRVDINNLSNNPIQINGNVSGSGTFLIQNTDNGNGGMIYATSSDFTDFSGSHISTNNLIISNTNSDFVKSGSQIQVRDAGSFTINVANTIKGRISRHRTGNGTGLVTFNANQEQMEELSVDQKDLALDFGPDVTLIQFSSYDNAPTNGNHGRVDLRNFISGVLKIGTEAGVISQVILDTWLIDGVEPADGTISQDAYGYIRINTVSSVKDLGTGSLNWEDGASWIGGSVPIATNNVVVYNDLIINSDVTINDLTIINESGAAEKVTVNPGYSLTVNGDAITRHNLYAESTSSNFSSLILNGNVSQHIGYNRYINASPGNDLISPPLPEVFNAIEAIIFANTNAGFETQRLFGHFDNTTGAYLIYETESSAGAGDNNYETELIPGKGYRAATINGTNVEFKGEPASPVADITVDITDGGDATYGPWNLIGNPFPSYLDFTAFFNLNKTQFDSGAFQAVYGYNGAASGDKWEEYNLLNLPPDGKIAPGQGFFVKTIASTTGTVTFTPAMRTIGNNDDFIAGRSTENINIALAKLKLSNSSNTFSTDIYFVDNQTRGLDPGYDAGSYVGSSSGIYTNLVENNTGINMAIQALPFNDFNDVAIPLGVKSDADVQLTIGLDETTRTIPDTINVYLEDNVTNTWTLLDTTDYIFTPSTALNGTGRFYVHFSSTALSTTDNLFNGLQIYSEQASKTVVIKGQLNANTSAVVYDMHGRLVLQQTLDTTNTTNVVSVNILKTGIYIVELKSDTQNRTQKVIIK